MGHGSSIADLKKFKMLREISRPDTINKHYKLGGKLGKGAFGEVKRATRLASNTEVAIKVIPKREVKKRKLMENLMMSELAVLKETSHPHIMRVTELLEDE